MLTIKNYIEIVNTTIRGTSVFIASIEETETQYRIAVANNHNIGFETVSYTHLTLPTKRIV